MDIGYVMSADDHDEETQLSRIYRRLRKSKTRVGFLVSIIIGILIHVAITSYPESIGSVLFLRMEFYTKIADAMIVASVVGLTYEWYTRRERQRELKELTREVVDELLNEYQPQASPETTPDELSVSDNLAMFTLQYSSEGTNHIQEKMSNADNIRVLGEIRSLSREHRTDGSNGEIDIHHGPSAEILAENEVQYRRICGYMPRDDITDGLNFVPPAKWLRSHERLFEAADRNVVSSYQLCTYPSVHAHVAMMGIDNDWLVMAMGHQRTPIGEYPKDRIRESDLILTTKNEDIVSAFNIHFDSLWHGSQEHIVRNVEDLLSMAEDIE
jgi:hypothetical protein